MPDQESSKMRSACSARSYDGIEHPGEAERRDEESATLVEHGLLDHLVRPPQQ